MNLWKLGASFSLPCFISNTVVLYTQVHSHTHKVKSKNWRNEWERREGRKIKAITETWTALLLGVLRERETLQKAKQAFKKEEKKILVCLVDNGERDAMQIEGQAQNAWVLSMCYILIQWEEHEQEGEKQECGSQNS